MQYYGDYYKNKIQNIYDDQYKNTIYNTCDIPMVSQYISNHHISNTPVDPLYIQHSVAIHKPIKQIPFDDSEPQYLASYKTVSPHSFFQTHHPMPKNKSELKFTLIFSCISLSLALHAAGGYKSSSLITERFIIGLFIVGILQMSVGS